MKRLFLLLLGLGLLYAVGALAWNVRETTRYFTANGREATLEIQQRYNAERWSSPLPVKKILKPYFMSWRHREHITEKIF